MKKLYIMRNGKRWLGKARHPWQGWKIERFWNRIINRRQILKRELYNEIVTMDQ